MRTKLCVLGAVLGTASVMPGVCLPSVESTRQTNETRSRGNMSLRAGRPSEGRGGEPLVPVEVPARPAVDGPMHPCELITVMQVPCDPAAATCEYTYWECPRNVTPLRA
ncbi:hypothetical protein [Melittangium boletus]|uniref:Uncharacterized protein n=1 Tax=Melittangium boletus DSM 14713 TaxID=1294270 RepID=A0A250IJX5_9BACT|nr:hypothetical protein [Melittangium boletus]ATB31510.1 hypothetical protein MEBOL_004973 [Melittangium boletus DSM 14713]